MWDVILDLLAINLLRGRYQIQITARTDTYRRFGGRSPEGGTTSTPASPRLPAPPRRAFSSVIRNPNAGSLNCRCRSTFQCLRTYDCRYVSAWPREMMRQGGTASPGGNEPKATRRTTTPDEVLAAPVRSRSSTTCS